LLSKPSITTPEPPRDARASLESVTDECEQFVSRLTRDDLIGRVDVSRLPEQVLHLLVDLLSRSNHGRRTLQCEALVRESIRKGRGDRDSGCSDRTSACADGVSPGVGTLMDRDCAAFIATIVNDAAFSAGQDAAASACIAVNT
jgi:hypothetical protein